VRSYAFRLGDTKNKEWWYNAVGVNKQDKDENDRTDVHVYACAAAGRGAGT